LKVLLKLEETTNRTVLYNTYCLVCTSQATRKAGQYHITNIALQLILEFKETTNRTVLYNKYCLVSTSGVQKTTNFKYCLVSISRVQRNYKQDSNIQQRLPCKYFWSSKKQQTQNYCSVDISYNLTP